MLGNRTPRYGTIAVALIFTGLGALDTFGSLLPDRTGAWLCVAATAVMLLGIFLPGL